MATNNRIIEIYRILGRILNDPASFGLGRRAPKSLVDELTTARQKLMEEIVEAERWSEEEENPLAAELSQDADRPMPSGNRYG